MYKSFKHNDILKGIGLTLQKARTLVVGKSGIGKSVLIKCIVRLIEPDRGEVDVLGTIYSNVMI